ncbi:unnamed protein product [Amoebophrya sp. A25]|nr:unnamed protein product [Amoebophrya sp. A25]|eukprot:GSA25T00001751001.1
MLERRTPRQVPAALEHLRELSRRGAELCGGQSSSQFASSAQFASALSRFPSGLSNVDSFHDDTVKEDALPKDQKLVEVPKHLATVGEPLRSAQSPLSRIGDDRPPSHSDSELEEAEVEEWSPGVVHSRTGSPPAAETCDEGQSHDRSGMLPMRDVLHDTESKRTAKQPDSALLDDDDDYEFRLLRVEGEEMARLREELAIKDFTIASIQRNLENLAILAQADKAELQTTRKLLTKERQTSEELREELIKVKETNLVLQQKVVRLRAEQVAKTRAHTSGAAANS